MYSLCTCHHGLHPLPSPQGGWGGGRGGLIQNQSGCTLHLLNRSNIFHHASLELKIWKVISSFRVFWKTSLLRANNKTLDTVRGEVHILYSRILRAVSPKPRSYSKYGDSWPNATSAWAGWSRFDHRVTRVLALSAFWYFLQHVFPCWLA